MNKKLIYIAVLSILIFSTLYPQQECDGYRYASQLFNNINISSNILYGGNYNPNIWGQNQWQDLYLDIYEPIGDELEERPLLLGIRYKDGPHRTQ